MVLQYSYKSGGTTCLTLLGERTCIMVILDTIQRINK